MKRGICLLWLLVTMVLSLPSVLAVTEKVCSEADLETLITEMAMAQEGKRTFTLGGYVTGKKIGKFLKKSYAQYTYANDYQYKWSNKGKTGVCTVSLKLKYRDSTRILAAVRNPKVRGVPLHERKAAEEVRRRIARYKFDGMPRKEIVKAVNDDLILRSDYYRSLATSRIPSEEKVCISLLLEGGWQRHPHDRCLFVILSALDIPCRLESHSVQVQLENGDWHSVSLSYMQRGMEVSPLGNPLRPAKVDKFNDSDDKEIVEEPTVTDSPDIAIPEHDSPKQFWMAAEKAYAAGKSAYGAILKNCPAKESFRQSLAEHNMSGGDVSVEDMYFPVSARGESYVRVMFTVEQKGNEIVEQEGKRSKKNTKQFKKLPENEKE